MMKEALGDLESLFGALIWLILWGWLSIITGAFDSRFTLNTFFVVLGTFFASGTISFTIIGFLKMVFSPDD